MKPKSKNIAVVAEGCLGVPNDETAAGRRPKPANMEPKRKPSDRPKVIAYGWYFPATDSFSIGQCQTTAPAKPCQRKV